MGDIDTVKVAVRIRPLVKNELEKGCQNVTYKQNGTQQIIVKNAGSYTFNYAFDTDEKQENLYNIAVKEMLPKLMKGYNVTILAYGQTGSGKTHTMGTAYNGIQNSEMGVIPRAVYEIYDLINEMSIDYQFAVTCSFIELYQENLYDLLSPNTRERSIVDIREDGSKGIVIPGLTETTVKTASETIECLIKGSSGRAVGATAMNQESSRSHAIFTINIQMMQNNDSKTFTTSKFHLVDLAGSERSKKTKATGTRFKEGVKINHGLLVLGNVISALGTGNGYVGYRDSKLTRLLQDSLGGNSVTLMIACVSPADYNMDETLSTLRYADRARKIRNKPIINEDPTTAEVKRLNGIIHKLRIELLNAGCGNISSNNTNGSHFSMANNNDIENMRKQLNVLCEKNRNLQQQLQMTLQDVAELEMRVVDFDSGHDKFQNKFGELYKLFINLQNNFNVNNCSSEFIEHAKKVDNIRNVIEDINNILRINKEELLIQKLSTLKNNSMHETDSLHSVAEDVQQKVDAFTKKQIDFHNKLRQMNRELNLKEQLQEKVTGNLSKLCVYEGDNTDINIKEFETKITILEHEKIELLDKLKCVKDNASAKIAEDRRKRLQQLEIELNELKRKNLQQSKLLKVREKESQKILNLNSEIHSMKAVKVKLIRQMKAESESFRQWKLNREKQLSQLKEKDRKRQNEMVRMESLHNKQKNFLKRKVEEATAINKRLKNALDKQKAAQSMKKLNGGPTGKIDHILTSIDHELEIVMSVIDAQYSLDQLMEDRAIINNRLNTLKNLEPDNKIEINTITEDLEMRNAQIDDLQQKIYTTDIDGKMKTVCEGIQSMPEAKAALKHLFNAITELRREYALKDNKIDEFKTSCELANEKVELLQKQYDISEMKYREEISNVEKNYEDKISVFLRELSNIPQQNYDNYKITPEITERMKIQQETLDKYDSLREELAEYKKKCSEIEKVAMNKKDRSYKIMHPKLKTLMGEKFGADSDMSSVEEDDLSKDPDWTVPIEKNSRLTRRKMSSNSTSTSIEEKKMSSSTFAITEELEMTGVKRNSEGTTRCNCKLPCNTKRCKCRSNNMICSDKCGCDENCTNTVNYDNSNEIKEENKENSNIDNEINEDTQTTSLTPTSTPIKKLKISTEDENNITPSSYPYSVKKIKPFYE